jgi:hypothetical protein
MHAFIGRERKTLSHRVTAVIGSVMANTMRPGFRGGRSKELIHENLMNRDSSPKIQTVIPLFSVVSRHRQLKPFFGNP